MAASGPSDGSHGYEALADVFMRVRNPRIGAAVVSRWCRSLPAGSAVLDLGCGHGIPVSRTLVDAGFAVYGVDASPTLIAAFRERLPAAHAECATVEESASFHRAFGAAVAWGLLFLLPPEHQLELIAKVARALQPGGAFLFTSPAERVIWSDALSGETCISLGREGYERALRAEGLRLNATETDEGDNHYYMASKAPVAPTAPSR
jgi:SAM-dependent methyltransferase